MGNELYYLSRTPHGIHLSNLFVQALAILAMSFRDQKDEPLIPTWDGEVAGWAEYSRRVRLCWAQTPSHKRYTLGPKLVLRLKGKAWEVASTVDHSQLEKTSGTPYLLKFLKAKLGRLPVPDVGQHLDELFVKSRRPVGMDLLSWCNQLRENYRRVQRALARTMTTKLEKGTQTDPTGTSPSIRTGSEPQRERPSPHPSAAAPVESGEPAGDTELDDEDGWSSPRSSTRSWRNDWWWNDWWIHGNWDWRSPSQYGSEYGYEEEPAVEWDEEDSQLPQILPEEVLGWLLLKRSSLPSAARLSIQAAAGNSLKISDVERAMRQQEDELLQMERQRGPGPSSRPARNFWVEKEDGAWGLVVNDLDDFETLTDDMVHWLTEDELAETFQVQSEPDESEAAWFSDGHYDWTWTDGDWMAYTTDGWVAYSDMKPWMDIDEVMLSDHALGKELHDLYVNFDQKVRSFKEAREAMHQKGKSRGYYPIHKGSSKGKSRGKGKRATAFSAQGSPPPKGKGKGAGDPVSKPGYTGCFICGNKTHDFRSCPQRGRSSASSASSRPIHYVATADEDSDTFDVVYMVEDETDSPPPTVPTVDLQRMILTANESDTTLDRMRFAVLDTGATETVGSLEAIEHIMSLRQREFGQETVGVSANKQKCFKFGNAQQRNSESYILLPQTCQGHVFSLGIYTLDVPGVPVLLGARTMKRLGAVIDVGNSELMFTKVFPGIRISLVRGRNGHLLLDLCRDWATRANQPSTGSELTAGPGVSKGGSEHVEPCRHVKQSEVVQVCDKARFEVQVVDLGESRDSSDTEVPNTLPVSDPVFQAQDSTARPVSFQASPVNCQVSHGPISGDFEARPSGRGAREDWQSHGDRDLVQEDQLEEGYRPEQVRLGPGGIHQPPGPQSSQGPMRGTSLCSTLWPGEFERHERARSVAHLRVVRSPRSVLPNVRGESHAPIGRPAQLGREVKVERDDRWRSDAEPADDPGLRPRCSRSLSPEESGRNPSPEGAESAEEGQRSQQREDQDPESFHTDGARPHVSHPSEEGGQAPQLGPGRGPGEVRRLGDRVHAIRGVVPRFSMSDLPQRIEDDSLSTTTFAVHEDTRPSFSCTCELLDEQKEMIGQQLERAQEEMVDALVTLGGSTCDLMEVCCGKDSGLVNKVVSMGGIGYRVGLDNDMDMSTEHGFDRASRFAEEVKPRHMWISIPCGPNSQLQNLHQKTPEQLRKLNSKRRKAKHIARRCIKLAKEQLARGGDVHWEWPRNNVGWQIHEVQLFFKQLHQEGLVYHTCLDGCQVGVCSPDTGEPMKKWTIKTTSKEIHTVLSLSCPRNHEHVECVGFDRAYQSGFYPSKMCKFARVVMEHTRSDSWDDTAFMIKGEEFLEPLSEKDLKHMKETIRRLHVRSGHPSNRALHAMLKARGVDSRVLSLALEHRCDECHEVKLPVPHHGVSYHTCDILWHTVQMDMEDFFFAFRSAKPI